MGSWPKAQMSGAAPGRRRRLGVSLRLGPLAVGVVTRGGGGGVFTNALTAAAGPAAPAASRQQIAQHILRTRAAQVMTSPAQAALRMVATGSKALATGPLPGQALPAAGPARPVSGSAQLAKPAFTNVRVNDPSLDTHQLDQTT